MKVQLTAVRSRDMNLSPYNSLVFLLVLTGCKKSKSLSWAKDELASENVPGTSHIQAAHDGIFPDVAGLGLMLLVSLFSRDSRQKPRNFICLMARDHTRFGIQPGKLYEKSNSEMFYINWSMFVVFFHRIMKGFVSYGSEGWTGKRPLRPTCWNTSPHLGQWRSASSSETLQRQRVGSASQEDMASLAWRMSPRRVQS